MILSEITNSQRFLLLQVRNPGDSMIRHEIASFARVLETDPDRIGVFDLLAQRSEVWIRYVFNAGATFADAPAGCLPNPPGSAGYKLCLAQWAGSDSRWDILWTGLNGGGAGLKR